jgi:hypothetical protein
VRPRNSFQKKICIGVLLYLTFPLLPLAGEAKRPTTSKSCKEFVGEFYSWYLELKLKNSGTRTSDLALKARLGFFSPYLVQLLREDSAAQDKAGSDLVSLDADPFIGADGPADRYLVKRVTLKNGKCWAQVYGVREHQEGPMPDVTPELELKNDQWRFVNFYFPSPSDPKSWNVLDELRSIRKSLRGYKPKK